MSSLVKLSGESGESRSAESKVCPSVLLNLSMHNVLNKKTNRDLFLFIGEHILETSQFQGMTHLMMDFSKIL